MAARRRISIISSTRRGKAHEPYATLRTEADHLRRRLSNLIELAGYWTVRPGFGLEDYDVFHERNFTAPRDIADFFRLLERSDELSTIARALHPTDRAWQYYATSRAEVDDLLDSHQPIDLKRPQGARTEVRWAAASSLRSALEMVAASLSRTPKPTFPPAFISDQLQKLTDLMLGAPSRQDRIAARSVLGDLLEQIGRGGEATAVRSGRWLFDDAVLPPLGVRFPAKMPVDVAYNRLGNAR